MTRSALEQVLFHGRDRGFNQVRPVVDGSRHDPVWQRACNLLEPGGNALRHRAAVLADQQHGRAEHGLFALERRRAGAKLLALAHLRNVPDAHRHAPARADHDVADFLGIRDLPGGADQVLLAVSFDVAGADIGIVGRQRRHHVAERQLVRHQAGRVRQHVELLFVAADRVHLDDTGNRAQLRLDDPILDGAEIGGGIRLALGIARVGLCLDREHVDFAEPGRDRAHRGLDARRQLVLHLLDALVDEVAGEIDVGPVQEHGGSYLSPVGNSDTQSGLARADRRATQGADLRRADRVTRPAHPVAGGHEYLPIGATGTVMRPECVKVLLLYGISDGILGLADTALNLADRSFGCAFRLALPVAGDFADRLLYGALALLRAAFDSIFVYHLLLRSFAQGHNPCGTKARRW
jgi:hypothetical protein